MNYDALEIPTAEELVKTLKLIPGFPWEEEAIKATVMDLVGLCRGSVLPDSVCSAYDQAFWLVSELRANWPRWQGSAAMIAVFNARFSPVKLRPNRPSPLSRPLAEMLFRQLSGFKGYPQRGPGEAYFIDAFQAACISVEHGQAVIAAFDQLMPTIREIRDTALNLKPKYEAKGISQQEQWEREYGKPQAVPVTFSTQRHVRRDDEIWAKLRERFPGCGRQRKDWPSWGVLAKAARELGYEDYARAWENCGPKR